MTDPIVEGVACACMDVQYNPKHNEEDGTARDRWTCKLCGMEYVKMAVFADVAEALDSAVDELEHQAAYINSLEQEMEDLDELLDDYREDSR